MPRIETVTTPQTHGAGRRSSYAYFANGKLIVPNQPALPDLATGRPAGLPAAAFGNNFVVGAPPAPRGGVIYKGCVANALTSNTGTGSGIVPVLGGAIQPVTMPFQTVKGTGNTVSADDFACWSITAILAFDAVVGAVTGDMGVSIGVATRAAIRTNVVAGALLGPSNTGTIGVVVRQADAGALTFNQACPDQPDMTEYNLYEIRLLSATDIAEASIKFLINGRLQFQLSYGAGTLLPDQEEGGGLGFTPGTLNFNAMAATTRMYQPPYSFGVKCGPTEASLL